MTGYKCPECGGFGNHKFVCVARCPTRKYRWPTAHDAQVALTEAKIRAMNGWSQRRRETRAYECAECKGWHLTSKEGRQ